MFQKALNIDKEKAMKRSKTLLILTCIATKVSLISIIFIRKKWGYLVYDLSMAIFGSALVSFIMSISDYYYERNKSIKLFCEEAISVLNELRKIKHIETGVPAELILACFQEEQENSFNEQLKRKSPPSYIHKIEPNKTAAKSRLITWIIENRPSLWRNNSFNGSTFEEIFKATMEESRNNYIRFINTSIIVANTDLRRLENAFNELEFLIHNEKIKQSAKTNIYDEIQDCINILAKEKNDFELLKSGNGNFFVCAKKANAINKLFFTESISIESHYEKKIVKYTMFDNIDDAIQLFRNKKDKKNEHVVSFSYHSID